MRRQPLKRRIVTAVVVAACVALFTWEWAAAPRVEASATVKRQLASVRGELFLGETFEGLPLRRVQPFLYSDCIPGRPHVTPCTFVRVADRHVTGSDPSQIARAIKRLRPVG